MLVAQVTSLLQTLESNSLDIVRHFKEAYRDRCFMNSESCESASTYTPYTRLSGAVCTNQVIKVHLIFNLNIFVILLYRNTDSRTDSMLHCPCPTVHMSRERRVAVGAERESTLRPVMCVYRQEATPVMIFRTR